MSHAALTRDLERLRKTREGLQDSQRQAADELVEVARRAIDEGMTMIEVCRLAGISREGLYKLMRRS